MEEIIQSTVLSVVVKRRFRPTLAGNTEIGEIFWVCAQTDDH